MAFADPAVRWRDGDGPLETAAYKGGALLAFALDVELRTDEANLLDLMRDLLRSGKPTELATLEAWVRGRGLNEFWEHHVAGTKRLDLEGLLRRAGFERDEQGQWQAAEASLRAFLAEPEAR